MNALIMAGAAKCIGCRTCEVAYVVTHQQSRDYASVSPSVFIPRIRVIKDDAFTTAVAYRQYGDAPCANVCSARVIRREHGYILIEQAYCIDYRGCTLAYPFRAANVVAHSSRAQAIKRDLYWHHEAGPACVEAYPTNVLQCVDAASIQHQRPRSQPL